MSSTQFVIGDRVKVVQALVPEVVATIGQTGVVQTVVRNPFAPHIIVNVTLLDGRYIAYEPSELVNLSS